MYKGKEPIVLIELRPGEEFECSMKAVLAVGELDSIFDSSNSYYEEITDNHYKLTNWSNFDEVINTFINDPKASCLEVFMDPEQDFIPKVKGILKDDLTILAPPIEEMSPLLPLDEVKNNMLIDISEKSKLIKR
jgi:hypothetical protein